MVFSYTRKTTLEERQQQLKDKTSRRKLFAILNVYKEAKRVSYQEAMPKLLLMFRNQKGCCAVCKKSFIGKSRCRPYLDNYKGYVRGIVCVKCAEALQHFQSSFSHRNIVKYLVFNDIEQDEKWSVDKLDPLNQPLIDAFYDFCTNR